MITAVKQVGRPFRIGTAHQVTDNYKRFFLISSSIHDVIVITSKVRSKNILA